MKDYAINEIIYHIRNKECEKSNLCDFLYKKYFLKCLFYFDIYSHPFSNFSILQW